MPSTLNEQLRDAYRGMAETPPPTPWRRIQIHVGGVTAVGFGPGTELLLVLSLDGSAWSMRQPARFLRVDQTRAG